MIHEGTDSFYGLIHRGTYAVFVLLGKKLSEGLKDEFRNQYLFSESVHILTCELVFVFQRDCCYFAWA